MFFLFLFLFLSLFGVVEILQRRVFREVLWSRALTHVGAGFILFFMPVYLERNQIVLLASLFTVALLLSRARRILSLHEVTRQSVGEVLYPFSILWLALFFLPGEPRSFQVGCLVLAFSDGFAGIVGERWPIREFRVMGNTKSLGGSIAFACVTLAVFLAFPPPGDVAPWGLAACVLSLTLLEFFLVFGFDNLFIPLISAWLYGLVSAL